jgi:hypothetical protein
MGYAHRDIDSLFDQVCDPIQKQQPRPHRRVGVEKSIEYWSHMQLPKPQWRGDGEEPTWLLLLTSCAAFGDVERSQNIAARGQICLAKFRQMKRSRTPVQQPHPEAILQLRDRAGDRRRRLRQIASGGRERPAVDRGDKSAHSIKAIHRCTF